jgi:hypothetical protein
MQTPRRKVLRQTERAASQEDFQGNKIFTSMWGTAGMWDCQFAQMIKKGGGGEGSSRF